MDFDNIYEYAKKFSFSIWQSFVFPKKKKE